MEDTNQKILQERQRKKDLFRFKRVHQGQAQDQDIVKPIPHFDHEHINSIFEDDPEKFLGEFEIDDKSYIINRKYIEGSGTHLRLYTTTFTPPKPVAQLCIFHGFGEHSGRFLHLADYFARQGITVYLIDLRGFGQSGGARGASTIEDMHKDMESLLSTCLTNLPLYLYGHSMGGLLVLSFALRNPKLQIAGLISTSALIGFPKDRKMSWFKVWVVKKLGKKLEDVVVNSMIHPTALTKNDQFIRKVFGDRLMIPFLGMNMGKSILEGTEYVLPNAFKLTFPILVIHGEQDTVTNPDDSIALYNSVATSAENKKLHTFPRGYHELQHDEECEELQQIVSEWIKGRSSKDPKWPGITRQVKHGVAKKKSKSSNWQYILLGILFVYFQQLWQFRKHPLFGKKLKLLLAAPLINLYFKFKN